MIDDSRSAAGRPTEGQVSCPEQVKLQLYQCIDFFYCMHTDLYYERHIKSKNLYVYIVLVHWEIEVKPIHLLLNMSLNNK